MEGVAGGDNLIHDLFTLCFGDAGAEGVFCKVTTNADTGRLDHLCLIFREGRADKGCGIHIGDVVGTGAVLVVVLDNSVEEFGEGFV